MALPRSITITKDGGNFYRSVAFRSLITVLALPFVVVAVLLAIVNPLWFRNDLFGWIEVNVTKLVQWRNYQQYRIYLGTDPKMWHALRDGDDDQ